MIVELIAAACGTIAFALLFGVPRKYYLYCGAIGAAGWLAYGLLVGLTSVGAATASFFATALVVLLCRFTAVLERCPATIFVITGIFPLVPGAKIYWAAYYLVTDQLGEAVTSGFSALKIMIAIVLGIVVIFELPHRFFHLHFRRTADEAGGAKR